MENFQLRADARNALKGNWVSMILGCTLIVGGSMAVNFILDFIPIIGWILGIFVGAIAAKAMIHFCFYLIENGKTSLDVISKGLDNWFDTGIALLLVGIFSILWSLLLFVPGIVKGLAYSQTLYILIDNPELRPIDAIKESQQLMQGYKMQLFTLYLSFIGWAILSILTLGIGFLFLIPYYNLTIANFYLELKNEKRFDFIKD